MNDSITRGLTTAEATRRLAEYGPNALPEALPDPLWRQIAGQLSDPLIVTLLASAIVAAAVASGTSSSASAVARYGDALAIILIVALNAVLGVAQERRASRALAALRAMAAPGARVFRDDEVRMIDAREIVPGDLLVLESGDRIAADATLSVARALATQEAAMTGESESVFKSGGDRILAGTNVVAGTGMATVTATGVHTELGRIGEMMRDIDVTRTPLQERLDQFGRFILRACLALAAVLFAWGLIRGGTPIATLLLEAVSLAVAAIPEGLPAITTIALALGMMRMARLGALVRRLSAVETLGAATVICTDKTGTLTRNEMTVVDALDLSPESGFSLAEACVRSVARETDPMEAALVHYGRARGGGRTAATVDSEEPFDPARRWSSVTWSDGMTALKGAVEAVLPLCGGDPEGHAQILAGAERMAERGLRVLLVAVGALPPGGRPEATGGTEPSGLRIAGLVGLQDPPREGVREAIAECRRAGIRVVMITGDHPATGVAIARDLGFYDAESTFMGGAELETMSDEALQDRIARVSVFARTSAAQKLRIVQALKARGDVVAMTGDGVNDAPALREAHIGVAMGKGGTDVAREAADLVLADDNFSTIVTAVEEGRSIYRNIQKFIFFLLSSNLGLVTAVFAVSFREGWPQLTPLMILWINLVTNGMPALALGVDPTEEAIMNESPRPPAQPLLVGRDLWGMSFVGLIMGIAGIAAYALAGDGPTGRTMAFCVLAFSPLVHAFSCRSPYRSAFSGRPAPLLFIAVGVSGGIQLIATAAPAIFHTRALSGSEWAWIAGLSLAVLPAVEVAKAFSRCRRDRSVDG
jgi:Ca2+-transporting ATPase